MCVFILFHHYHTVPDFKLISILFRVRLLQVPWQTNQTHTYAHVQTRLHTGSWLKAQTPHPDQDFLINVQQYTPFTNTHFRCGVLKVCEDSGCAAESVSARECVDGDDRLVDRNVWVSVCGGSSEDMVSLFHPSVQENEWQIIWFLGLIHWTMVI